MDKPKSLVEVLQQKAKAHRGIIVADPDCNLLKDHLALERAYYAAAELAEPYEARCLALEKVAEAAQRIVLDDCAEEDDIDRLIRVLAAVPPLPEVQDGS